MAQDEAHWPRQGVHRQKKEQPRSVSSRIMVDRIRMVRSDDLHGNYTVPSVHRDSSGYHQYDVILDGDTLTTTDPREPILNYRQHLKNQGLLQYKPPPGVATPIIYPSPVKSQGFTQLQAPTPDLYGSNLRPNHAPSHHGGAPSHHGGTPSHLGGTPSHHGGAPSHHGGTPSHLGGTPSHLGGAPSYLGNTPSHVGSTSIIHELVSSSRDLCVYNLSANAPPFFVDTDAASWRTFSSTYDSLGYSTQSSLTSYRIPPHHQPHYQPVDSEAVSRFSVDSFNISSLPDQMFTDHYYQNTDHLDAVSPSHDINLGWEHFIQNRNLPATTRGHQPFSIFTESVYAHQPSGAASTVWPGHSAEKTHKPGVFHSSGEGWLPGAGFSTSVFSSQPPPYREQVDRGSGTSSDWTGESMESGSGSWKHRVCAPLFVILAILMVLTTGIVIAG